MATLAPATPAITVSPPESRANASLYQLIKWQKGPLQVLNYLKENHNSSKDVHLCSVVLTCSKAILEQGQAFVSQSAQQTGGIIQLAQMHKNGQHILQDARKHWIAASSGTQRFEGTWEVFTKHLLPLLTEMWTRCLKEFDGHYNPIYQNLAVWIKEKHISEERIADGLTAYGFVDQWIKGPTQVHWEKRDLHIFIEAGTLMRFQREGSVIPLLPTVLFQQLPLGPPGVLQQIPVIQEHGKWVRAIFTTQPVRNDEFGTVENCWVPKTTA